MLTAHICNWEWLLPGTGAQFGIPIDAVYKPLRVASLDAFIRDTRSRFGGKPIPIQSFLFELMRRAGEARAYAMVADQTPPRNMDKYWTRFLNQDTAFFTGADKIARFLDAPVIYVAMRRVRKGHYSVRAARAGRAAVRRRATTCRSSSAMRGGSRSEIRANPADWLWVHNKWKYPKPGPTSDGPAAAHRGARKDALGDA